MNHRQMIAIGTGSALLIASWLWTPTIWASVHTTNFGAVYGVFHGSPFPGATKVAAVRIFVPIDAAIIAVTAAAVYFMRSRHARVEHSN